MRANNQFMFSASLLVVLGQLFCTTAGSALPNALPARHPPEAPPAVATVTGSVPAAGGTSGLGLLRIGPVPAVHSTAASAVSTGSAPPTVAVGPAPAGSVVAPASAAVPPATEDPGATLGADACAANGECARLGEAVVSAVEGVECRSLHITGKCPAKCLGGLNAALEHKLWAACAARCETDVVAGAAHRWVKLCEARQVTLLDQGKEAVKSLVVSGPAAGRALQAIGILAILVGAVMIGYRHGLLQGHALRLQKRMKKRSSERNFV